MHSKHIYTSYLTVILLKSNTRCKNVNSHINHSFLSQNFISYKVLLFIITYEQIGIYYLQKFPNNSLGTLCRDVNS